MDVIRENIKIIKEGVARAAASVGKSEKDITIVAATKTVTPEGINIAIDEGIVNIGENRVQEFTEKYDSIDERAIHHFIGHLQTNKLKYILGKVELIHSVDSVKLLDEIEKLSAKKEICTHVLLEVNASGEESKFGFEAEDVWEALENNEKNCHVKIDGLMTIGPNYSTNDEIRKVFRNLSKLFLDISQKKYNNSSMKFLSMGMSADYETAIEEGANVVRVGSAIFGQRIYK